nr:MAG TPA: minor tail protein [Caudoviricetes sp.]
MADVDITSLSVEISAESQGAELNIDKLATAISNLRTKGNVTKVVNSLDKLSASISALKQASTGLSGLDNITNFLNGIGNANFSGSVKSINSVVNAIKKIPAAVSGLNGVDFYSMSGSITELTNAMAPLSILDASGLKAIGSAVNAIGKIPDLSEKLKAADLDAFSDSCNKISTAITPLASQLDKVGNAFAKLPSQLSKVVTQANRVTAANEKQRKSYLSLSNQMNGFMRNMAKLVSLKAIAEYLGNAVAKFNDFYEATDLFHNAMGNLSGEADALISKMQGLLGVDPTKAMTYMATIQSLGTSFGLASDKAYVLSKNLTQLAYDEGSYWNKDVAETFTAMSSAISGEIEPIRRLGVDLSQARLQQELLALGFNKQVSSLSQADKAVLRYIAIMKQTANVQGNLAQTIQSPANQIKILKAQLDMLAKSVGSLLYPALKSILPPLIAAVQLIREFVEWVAKLMGVKVVFTDFTKSADSVGGIGDAMDDTADSTKKAAKALKDYTMGFDELNIIDPTQGSSGSGSGASAGNILGDVDLSGYDMFKNYVGTSVDKIKEKIRGLLPLIESIAAAFALWELGKFIKQIGEVIKGMNGIQKAAAMIAILVVEWTLVQKFSDSFLKTGDVKAFFAEWLATAAAAIGGYALFGAEGASLALIVSAVAQLESIKTNLSQGTVKATDASVWIQGISAAVTTGIAGAVFTKTVTGFSLGLSVGAVLALSAITYGGTKGGSIKPGDSIDALLTALTAAAGGLAGVTLALAAGASAPIAGAALILGVGVGIVLEQLGITFGEKDRIKDVEDYIKRYEDAGYTTLAIHYRLKNLGFSDDEINMAEQGIDSTFEIFRYTFNEKLKALNEWWNKKWEGFKENFGKSWDSLKNAVSSAKDGLDQASADLKQWFVGVGEWWNQKWEGFKTNWDNAWNSLVDTVKNIPKKMLEYGKNIVDGLIKGINQGIETAKKTVGGLAKAILDKFTGDLDIHSPSKLFEQFGIYVDQGLANGITAARGYVDEAMQGLINGVTNAGNQFIEQGKQTGIGFVNSLDQTLTSTWQQLDTNLQNDFFGTIQNLWEAAQSGDVKTIGTTIAAVLWHAMGEEQRTQIKTIATNMITDLSTQLTNALSTLSAQAYQIGGELLNGITSKFGEIVSTSKRLGNSLKQTFTAIQGPMSSTAKTISGLLSKGLASAFPSIYASMGTLIGTIGASFVAMLNAIGAALSATIFGIPAGLIALGAAAVLAASIAGIVGGMGGKRSSSGSSYGSTGYDESDLGQIDYSNVPGTSQYNDVNSGVQSSYAASTTQISAEEIREAVYNGAYNALLDYKQRYDQGDKDNILKVYLDGKQLTATVEKRKNERGRSIMGTEAYSY